MARRAEYREILESSRHCSLGFAERHAMMNFADRTIAPAGKYFLGNEVADLAPKTTVDLNRGSSLCSYKPWITLMP